jgi:hypothetical protein
MNACAKKRKLIVELAMEALEPREARALRAHLESCAGCREYLAEISKLSARLKVAESGSDVEAPEAFHQRVMRVIREEEARSWWGVMATTLRGGRLSWRVAVPGVGGLAVAMVLLLILVLRPSSPPTASAPSPALVSQELEDELPPSVANYRVAANRSLDHLDEVLTQQANRRVSTRQVYTASVLALDVKLAD